MEVIRTPDPDPFVDKWHPAIGHVKRDDKHKVECEVCHRYLKTFTLQVEHVKTFHPTVFYDCIFCPGVLFYTIWDLLSYCKKNHFVCHQCDSTHKDQDALKQHMVTRHPEQPAQAGPEGARKGLYVVNVACTVVQWLYSGFILLLIKRHHVLSVHRNFSMLPAETSTSA